jgi:hypothetical protein
VKKRYIIPGIAIAGIVALAMYRIYNPALYAINKKPLDTVIQVAEVAMLDGNYSTVA